MRVVLSAALICFSVVSVFAFDNGQWGDVPDNVRAWFNSVKSPHGVPCCSTSDGHRTTWRGTSDGGIEVPIGEDLDGSPRWVPVPPESIVYNAGNPTEDSIVWYVPQVAGIPYIRCFIFGGGV